MKINAIPKLSAASTFNKYFLNDVLLEIVENMGRKIYWRQYCQRSYKLRGLVKLRDDSSLANVIGVLNTSSYEQWERFSLILSPVWAAYRYRSYVLNETSVHFYRMFQNRPDLFHRRFSSSNYILQLVKLKYEIENVVESRKRIDGNSWLFGWSFSNDLWTIVKKFIFHQPACTMCIWSSETRNLRLYRAFRATVKMEEDYFYMWLEFATP